MYPLTLMPKPRITIDCLLIYPHGNRHSHSSLPEHTHRVIYIHTELHTYIHTYIHTELHTYRVTVIRHKCTMTNRLQVMSKTASVKNRG